MVGDYCLAPFNDGTTLDYLLPCRIETNVMNQYVDVFFVDYGNKSRVAIPDLFELPDRLRRLPFQAFECELSHVKPSVIKCPSGTWTDEARRHFQHLIGRPGTHCSVSIYSVVHDVVRVRLLASFNGSDIDVGQHLVDLQYADNVEESSLSVQSHQQRERESHCRNHMVDPELASTALQARGRALMDIHDAVNLASAASSRPGHNGSHSGRIRIRGPWSSYEISFTSCTYIGKMCPTHVERDSVNSVALYEEPCNPQPNSFAAGLTSTRMMVASTVMLNSSKSSLTARDTTIMPAMTGLFGLVTLIFTPVAELRTDEAKTKYTGALCGLGWDPQSPNSDSAFADNDIELTFDFVFTDNELRQINLIREALNMAASISYGEDAMARIQYLARKRMLDLLKVRREAMTPIPFPHPYHWRQVKPSDICPPATVEVENHTLLYQMHSSIRLGPALALSPPRGLDAVASVGATPAVMTLEEKTNHHKWLKSKASRSTEHEEMVCRLCDVRLVSPYELLMHLASRLHRENQPI